MKQHLIFWIFLINGIFQVSAQPCFKLGQFADDLDQTTNAEFKALISGSESEQYIEAWQVFKNGDLPLEIRTSSEWLNLLKTDLANSKYTLHDIFEQYPEDILIWKELKDNPYSKLDFIDETSDPLWLRWKDREFFKAIVKKGHDFEILMNPRIKNDLIAFGVDLENTVQIDQLHVLGPNGNKVIMDNCFLKQVTEIDEMGISISYTKAIYNDCKYSDLAGWTPNQKSEIINLFKNDSDLDYVTIELRSANERLVGTNVQQGDFIRLYRNDVFKTTSDGQGGFGQIIQMSITNFID